jgi:hypothetical protein
MLWFLFALLREGAPSTSYLAVPVLRQRRGAFQVLDLECESEGCNHRVNLLENQNHEQGKFDSGLITLDVRTSFGGMGWRPIQFQRNYIAPECRR